MRGKEKSRQRRPDGVIVLALAAAGLMSASGSWAASFNFTTDTDWATGVLTNTTGNPPPNAGDGHVRLVDNLVTPFNYIWVAASGRGTAIRIDTDVNPAIIGDGDTFLTTSEASGTAVKGEYYTAPSGRAKNPSRTTVDLNGDVWVANRDESSGGLGSAAKISSNPTGTTSNGIFNSGANGGVAGTYNALPWTNAGGADNNGGTSTATDSAQMLYVRTAGTNARTIAVDANNDVWVGGYGDREHQLYHGDTGAAISPIKNFGPNSGYGGVIDGNGVLWSSGWSNTSLSRYDPATGIETNPNVGGGSYGLAVDNDGNIWNTHFSWNTVSKLDPNGAVLFTKSSGGSQSRGVAVTPADNNIWIANSASDTVTRLDTNGNGKLDVDEMQGWTPRTDITETKKKYIVKADLPEVEKEDMHVSVKDGALLIEGERRQHNEEEDEKFHRIESMYGKFSRMFTLPPNVDEAHIKAKAKDGVLRVHIPKLSESEPAEEKEVKID